MAFRAAGLRHNNYIYVNHLINPEELLRPRQNSTTHTNPQHTRPSVGHTSYFVAKCHNDGVSTASLAKLTLANVVLTTAEQHTLRKRNNSGTSRSQTEQNFVLINIPHSYRRTPELFRQSATVA